jgi:hypothetical protein
MPSSDGQMYGNGLLRFNSNPVIRRRPFQQADDMVSNSRYNLSNSSQHKLNANAPIRGFDSFNHPKLGQKRNNAIYKFSNEEKSTVLDQSRGESSIDLDEFALQDQVDDGVKLTKSHNNLKPQSSTMSINNLRSDAGSLQKKKQVTFKDENPLPPSRQPVADSKDASARANLE